MWTVAYSCTVGDFQTSPTSVHVVRLVSMANRRTKRLRILLAVSNSRLTLYHSYVPSNSSYKTEQQKKLVATMSDQRNTILGV